MTGYNKKNSRNGVYEPIRRPPRHRCEMPRGAEYLEDGQNNLMPREVYRKGSLWECPVVTCGRWWVYKRSPWVLFAGWKWQQARVWITPITVLRITKLIRAEETEAMAQKADV